ncbi:hypothetical protein Godav_011401 [Gossypium davidsonii]|uniref:Uncharacterized protein n=1 Tax=Gossypium davidsonii TaxID=34287 RepID=A0A7J8R9R6_GOSDV|nr:hypothetical protein [Gossypium davidsonii]
MIRLNCSHDSSIGYCIEFVVALTTNVVSHILDPAIRSRARCYRENEVDFLVDERKVNSLAASQWTEHPLENSKTWSQRATRGGLVKIDWTQAPFTALYRNFNANACVWSN